MLSVRTSAVALLLPLAALPVAAQVERPEQLTFPDIRSFDIPKPEVHTLPNGLTVMLMVDRELPLITARAMVRTGGLFDPADKTGLAGLTGAVQRIGGTKNHSGDELDLLLEARAASIEASIGETSGNVTMSCLSQDFDFVLPLFNDVLRFPAFAEDKVDLAKVQAKSGIARRNDNVGGIASREFRRAIYGADSAMGRQTEYSTLNAITRDDLIAFHAGSFHPNATILGVVGDFEPKAMLAKLTKTFGDWKRGPEPASLAAEPTSQAGPRVLSVTKTDVNQAQIRVGHLGMRITDPDYFAVQVMNEVLGGGFAGRLFKNVRSEKGLAYSVGGGVGAGFAYPGTMTLTMSTKFSTVGAAITALQEEVAKMRAAAPEADEMARAKESILNGFVFNYASKSQVLAQRMSYLYQGLPADFLEQYQKRVEAVTAEEVLAAAQARLRPEEMVILVAGNPEGYDRPLSDFGTVENVDITIPPPEVKTAHVETSDASVAAGKALLARVVAAMGGPDAAAVKAIASEATLTVSLQGQQIGLARTSLTVFPDRIREVVRSPMGEQTQVIVGDRGWMEMGGQRRDMPAEMVAKQLQDLGRDLRTIVRYADDPALEALAGQPQEVKGTTYETLVVKYRGAESEILVAADGTVAFQRYAGVNPLTGAPGAVEVELLAYRDVGGRQVPHEQLIKVDGDPIGRSSLTKFEIDPAFDPAVFE